ncbi:hypothetical protein tb265_07160 [Gemmatimonadetes bacterium T265]|nr:hypothetical protein tb265_07160 [Gemmatimonadetes bacterium T265]
MTSAERKAVGFFAVLAAAGAGARALGVGDPSGVRPPAAADRLALQHQLDAVDSAHARRERGRAAKGSGRRVGGKGRGRRTADSTSGSPPALGRAEAPSAPVDVNRADTVALATLPGVGPALARRIVADRAAHGGFASMAELSRVRGIGTALEHRLAGAVTFSGVPSGGVTFTVGGRPSSGSTPGSASRRRSVPAGAAGGWPAP